MGKSGKEIILPLFSIMGDVLLPGQELLLSGNNDVSSLIEINKGRMGVVTLFPGEEIKPGTIGTYAVVNKDGPKAEEGVFYLQLRGVVRFRIKEIDNTRERQWLLVEIINDKDNRVETKQTSMMAQAILQVCREFTYLSKSQEMVMLFQDLQTPRNPLDFAYMAMSFLDFSIYEKQEILEILKVEEQLQRILDLYYERRLANQKNMKAMKEAAKKMNEEAMKFKQRQSLMAQRKMIDMALGEGEDGDDDLRKLSEKLEAAGLPPEAKAEADKELNHLRRLSPQSSESGVLMKYLETIAGLPWNKSSKDNLDIRHAKNILTEDHSGLEKVKRIILEYLAVRKLKPDSKGKILCLVGPPGTGKTSLGRSIARAMGRQYLRLALGGVKDEAEIRGHRRTYVGAMPGKMIESIERAGTNNPVFVLDEVDKLGSDSFRGDPSSALLEALDPEQNNTFRDHYLGVPFDLSNVFFIATANNRYTIPPPLLDRMEVVEIPGYTREEKLDIAEKYLVGRRLADNGLSEENVKFSPEALAKIIDCYTFEAGVRKLEQHIGTVCRGLAARFASGKTKPIEIGEKDLKKYLGVGRFSPQLKEKELKPGVSTCLFWTPLGGSIGFTEIVAVEGKGKVILTGQLGDVMKESISLAITFIKENAEKLKISKGYFDNKDIHLHFPEGAIKKDGPSAGVAILTALVSLIKGKPVPAELAMTGEITLRGQVLPIGGLKEKVLGAQQAGIKTIIAPKDNRKDLTEIPKSTRKEMKFHFVGKMEDVLKIALGAGNE